MKALLATGALALALLTLPLVPADATRYMKFDGIDQELSQSAEELQEIIAAGDQPTASLLLPAIQKVREAASRTGQACGSRDGEFQMDCAQDTLAAAILDSTGGRDDSLGLLQLVGLALGGPTQRAQGQHIKVAKLFVSEARENPDAAQGTEQLMMALLIGLKRHINADAVLKPVFHGRICDPIVNAIMIAEEIDPNTQSCKVEKGKFKEGGSTYNLVLLKK